MEKIPNQNKFVGGARICASSACCCIDLLHQIWPKKPSPAHLEFALEETLVKARWEGEMGRRGGGRIRETMARSGRAPSTPPWCGAAPAAAADGGETGSGLQNVASPERW
jgi:hypothetical protein